MNRDCWIASVHTPAIARKFAEVKPNDLLFTVAEVELMRGLPEKEVILIAQVKEVFPNCEIVSVSQI